MGGVVMFIAFVLFGLIPKFPYLFLYGIDYTNKRDPRFGLSIMFTGIAMFLLGAYKARYALEVWWKSGLWVLITGGIAAAVAFGIGDGIQGQVKIGGC